MLQSEVQKCSLDQTLDEQKQSNTVCTLKQMQSLTLLWKQSSDVTGRLIDKKTVFITSQRLVLFSTAKLILDGKQQYKLESHPSSLV